MGAEIRSLKTTLTANNLDSIKHVNQGLLRPIIGQYNGKEKQASSREKLSNTLLQPQMLRIK